MSTIAKIVRLRVSGDGLGNVIITVYAKLYDGAAANIGQNRYSLCRFHLAPLLNGRVPNYDKLTFTLLDRYESAPRPTTVANPPSRPRPLPACTCAGKEGMTHYCYYHGQQ